MSIALSNWKNGAQAAVNAIRATNAENYILLPGKHKRLSNLLSER